MSKDEIVVEIPNPAEGAKLSKRSLDLAKAVLDKSDGIKKDSNGNYGVDLTGLIGMGFGSDKSKKEDALEDVTRQLALTIEDGSLVLGDEYTKEK